MSYPKPSDLTLAENYVAIEPGNYGPKTDLTPFKGTNLDATSRLDYHLPVPLGVGDEHSVVYVYPQGTIEVIGKVYCWNMRVKPGVYSRYEKLRYLHDNDIIHDRTAHDVYKHHASYNKTLRVANPFVRLRNERNEGEWKLAYHYVSFDEQILGKNGSKVYPVPIMNGRITIYPDGTFKAENIVIRSTDKKVLDPYGYLNDHDTYASVYSYYSDAITNDANPRSIYKLISENADGSVTYGAVEANQRLTPGSFPRLPLGIVPINDGKVTMSLMGGIDITGTVISGTGYRIYPGHYYPHELVTNEQGVLTFNENHLDKSKIWNPSYTKLDGQGSLGVIGVADGIKDVYRYHPENGRYFVVNLEETNKPETNIGYSVTYLPMTGYDRFTTKPATDSVSDVFDYILSSGSIVANKIDKTHYPITYFYRLDVGDKSIYPHLRYTPEGELNSYVTIDHTLLWNVTKLSPYPVRENEVVLTGRRSNRPNRNFYRYPELVSELVPLSIMPLDHCFIPYNHKRPIQGTNQYRQVESSVKITKEGNTYFVETKGYVIYKRGEEYFTLEEGKCKLDLTWPAIKVDGELKYDGLFSVNGYFNTAPIFINKADQNSVYDVFGAKRDYDGVFKLVKRHVTHYLNPHDKMLLDQCKKHVVKYRVGDLRQDFNILEECYYYLNEPYTEKTCNIILDYFAFNFSEVIPSLFTPNSLNASGENRMNALHRLFYYDQDQSYLHLFNEAGFALANGFTLKVSPSDHLVKPNKYSNLILNKQAFPADWQRYRNYTYWLGSENSQARNGLFNEITFSFYGVNQPREYTSPNGNMNRYLYKYTLENGPLQLQVNVPFRQQVNVFYRTSEDNRNMPKMLTSQLHDHRTIVTLDEITLKGKYGWVDIWTDDPFYEVMPMQTVNGNNRNRINGTVYRIYLKRDRNSNPIHLYELRNRVLPRATKVIHGLGEPKANLVIYEQGKENVILHKQEVTTDGTWAVKDKSVFKPRKQYVIKQTDFMDMESYLEFQIQP